MASISGHGATLALLLVAIEKSQAPTSGQRGHGTELQEHLDEDVIIVSPFNIPCYN